MGDEQQRESFEQHCQSYEQDSVSDEQHRDSDGRCIVIVLNRFFLRNEQE